MESTPHEDPEALEQARQLGHEWRDIHLPGVVAFAAGLIVLIALALGAMYWLVLAVGGPHPQGQQLITSEQTPAIFDRDVQANQLLLRLADQQVDRQVLTSYGWIDRSQGIARIPVDRAIQLLAQQQDPALPLPADAAQAEAAPADTSPAETPTEETPPQDSPTAEQTAEPAPASGPANPSAPSDPQASEPDSIDPAPTDSPLPEAAQPAAPGAGPESPPSTPVPEEDGPDDDSTERPAAADTTTAVRMPQDPESTVQSRRRLAARRPASPSAQVMAGSQQGGSAG